jgi:hypothetical protein
VRTEQRDLRAAIAANDATPRRPESAFSCSVCLVTLYAGCSLSVTVHLSRMLCAEKRRTCLPARRPDVTVVSAGEGGRNAETPAVRLSR